jgi:shikimate dehydrogenase
VYVVNRSRERAQALARTNSQHVFPLEPDSSSLVERVAGSALVVNATPLGMSHYPDDSPLPAQADLNAGTVVIDLVYGRETPLLARARRAGCRTQDGAEMLVLQAAAAFHLWTGLMPPVDIMRTACRAALGEKTACSVS